MHNHKESSCAQKCEGGHPKAPGITAAVSTDLYDPRAHKYDNSYLFPIVINYKYLKLL